MRQTTINAHDFTKANALFNAALVAFRKDDDGMSVDEIRYEIDSHKEWVAETRKIFKERVNDIDQNRETEQKEEVLRINMFHYTLFLSLLQVVFTYLHRRTGLEII